MEHSRKIIYVALFVVAYLMFLAWQKDYGQQQLPVQAATQSASPSTAQPGTAGATPTAAGVSATASTASGAGDLAGLAPASGAAAGDVPPVGALPGGNRVEVQTDVLNVVIDLNGGDIVGLDLPKFAMSLSTPDQPVKLMTIEGHTYIAQSGLVSALGPDMPDGTRGVFTSATSRYELAAGTDTLEVVLTAPANNGVTVEKIFRFKRGDYLVDVQYRVVNQGTQAWTGFLFGQLKRDQSGDPSHPNSGGMFSSSPTYLGGAYFSDEKVYNKINFGDMQEQPLKIEAQGGWISFIQHYFIGAWVPAQEQRNQYFTRYRADDGSYLLGFTSPQVTVAPGGTQEIGAAFYAGPKTQDRLKAISSGLELTVDYGWFWFIAQPLFWLLVHIEGLVGNWGVAIILLTVLVKGLFFYPSHVSYRSMAHMRRITPELTRIRDEYKNDRQKQSMEMLALYRKEKINPLGGCLPILIQMPVFIALYWVLLESVELRQAPFMLWVQDLSVMDPYFVLPLLMGASMWIQTSLNPAPPDPMQAKMMKWLPIVFTFFFLFFAAGLVLYWLVNNILSILQQWYITRQIEKQHGKTT